LFFVSFILHLLYKTTTMKARESKKARKIFSSEADGRSLLRKIYEAAKESGNQHIETTVKIGNKTIQVTEL